MAANSTLARQLVDSLPNVMETEVDHRNGLFYVYCTLGAVKEVLAIYSESAFSAYHNPSEEAIQVVVVELPLEDPYLND